MNILSINLSIKIETSRHAGKSLIKY